MGRNFTSGQTSRLKTVPSAPLSQIFSSFFEFLGDAFWVDGTPRCGIKAMDQVCVRPQIVKVYSRKGKKESLATNNEEKQ